VANGHGGQRTPNNPAPVSGPGALSQRTDGGAATQPQMVAPGNGYGERQEMLEIQGGSPMQGGGGAVPAPPTPLGDPTANPLEPITAGAELGPGVGPAAAGIQSDREVTNEQLRPLLRSLEIVANLPGSNAETRSFVRQLKARLGSG
jgi:hypothetical protein